MADPTVEPCLAMLGWPAHTISDVSRILSQPHVRILDADDQIIILRVRGAIQCLLRAWTLPEIRYANECLDGVERFIKRAEPDGLLATWEQKERRGIPLNDADRLFRSVEMQQRQVPLVYSEE